MGPLHGVRVVEWGEMVSAPACGRFLAGLGAQVIKVEPPDTGDRARHHGPFLHDVPHPERSGLFLFLNTNKLGVTLDPSSDSDRGLLFRLLESADAFITNYPVAALECYGLDPPALLMRFPRLVVCLISPFGSAGPYSRFKAYDLQACAAGGVSVTVGEPGRPPLALPCSQGDYQGGLNAAIGILLALFARGKSGVGQVVDISTAQVLAYYGGITASMYTPYGIPWERAGHRASRSGGYYPYTILPTRDGYICMITRSGHPWKRFVEAMGSPGWARNPRYRDRARMGRDYPDEVDSLLAPWLREHTSQEVLEICRREEIPFSVVRTLDQVASCPQLTAREFWVVITHDETGPLRYPGAPFKLSRTPWVQERPAPRRGEHNHILEEFQLSRSGVLGPTPGPRYSGTPKLPLEGVRVLDFGWVAVGPVLGSLLADMGAEVIKVESRARLDYCRLIPTPLREDEAFRDAYSGRAEVIDRVPLFHQYNRGKRGITVNLGHPKAPSLILELVQHCDVVIENFTPRVLRGVGLTYERLRQARPDLVMISVSAAGQGGPWENLRAFAPSLTSLAGFEGLVGYQRERVLGAMTLGYSDPSNAHHGALAVLAALWHRERTGEGQHIDMSQMEATAGLVGEALMDYFMNGRVWGPRGNRHLSMAPHGTYPCRGDDQWVAIAVGSEGEWGGFCRALGEPLWSAQFGALADRLSRGEELDRLVGTWTRTRTAWEVTRILQEQGVAAFPVLRLEELEEDPHFAARELRVRVSHPRLGEMTLYNTPIALRETPGRPRKPAPALGEDNDFIFGELLKMDRSLIDALVADGVIA